MSPISNGRPCCLLVVQAHCPVLMVLDSHLLYFGVNSYCFYGMNLQLDLSMTACSLDSAKVIQKNAFTIDKLFIIK